MMPGGRVKSLGGRSDKAWVEHAIRALEVAGYHRGGARFSVIELLSRRECGVTALEIEQQLRDEGQAVGRASVYRTLEQLEELGLTKRLEIERGMATYERVHPTGDHHHHAVCERCGRVVRFEDPGLERAIGRVEGKVGFQGSGHEVVLRGRCSSCS